MTSHLRAALAGYLSGAITSARLAALAALPVFTIALLTQIAANRFLLFPLAVGNDTATYLAAGERLNADHPLYALSPGDRDVWILPPYWTTPLVSPPAIAVMWRPLAALPEAAAAYGWWIAGTLAVVATVTWFLRTRSRSRVTLVLLLSAELGYTAWAGNVSAFLLPVLLEVWWALERGQPVLAGGLVAIAASIKLLPVILVLWLITRGEWRAVAGFVAAAAIAGAITLLGAGLDNHVAWVDVARQTAEVGATPGSLPGILTRLGLNQLAPLAIPMIWVFAIGSIVGARRHPRLAFMVAVAALTIASPAIHPGSLALLLAARAPLGARSAEQA